MQKEMIFSKDYSFAAMKLFLSALIALFLLHPDPLQAELVDRVVAVINDDIITLSDLHDEGKSIFEKIKKEAPAHEKKKILDDARKKILAVLIEKRLIRQRAAERRISVKPAEIDTELKKILELNNTTLEQFQEELSKTGLDEEHYRASLGDSILRSRLVNFEIRSKLVLTETMTQEYYEKKYLANIPQGYHILQMGFSWVGANNKTKQEAALKAAEARNLAIMNGKDFKELAKLHSDLPSARDGGDIGAFSENELASYMRDTILALKPGEVSPIVETPSGYQFFKLLSYRKGTEILGPPLESVKQDIEESLFKQEIEKQYEKWMQDLKDRAYIKTML